MSQSMHILKSDMFASPLTMYDFTSPELTKNPESEEQYFFIFSPLQFQTRTETYPLPRFRTWASPGPHRLRK